MRPDKLTDLRDRIRARQRRGDPVGGCLVGEYVPPPREEAWLNLPPGCSIDRDDPDWEPRHSGSYVRWPQIRSEMALRFRTEFGNQAAQDWSLEPDPVWLMEKTMRETFTSKRLEQQFFDESPFARALENELFEARVDQMKAVNRWVIPLKTAE